MSMETLNKEEQELLREAHQLQEDARRNLSDLQREVRELADSFNEELTDIAFESKNKVLDEEGLSAVLARLEGLEAKIDDLTSDKERQLEELLAKTFEKVEALESRTLGSMVRDEVRGVVTKVLDATREALTSAKETVLSALHKVNESAKEAAGSIKESVKTRIDTIKEAAGEVKTEWSQKASDMVLNVQSAVLSARDSFKETIKTAGEHLLAKAYSKLDSSMQSLEAYAKKQGLELVKAEKEVEKESIEKE